MAALRDSQKIKKNVLLSSALPLMIHGSYCYGKDFNNLGDNRKKYNVILPKFLHLPL